MILPSEFIFLRCVLLDTLWKWTVRVLLETRAPPVIGKEEMMRLTRQLASVCALCAFLCITSRAFSLDIYLNDSFHTRYSDSELEARTYTILLSGELEAGVSLLEVMPLMGDAYRMEAISPQATLTLTDRDYGSYGFVGEFCCWYLVRTGTSWRLTTGQKQLDQVSRISIYGEPVRDRELEVWLSWEGVPELKDEISAFARIHDVKIKTVDVPQTESKLISVLRGGGKLPDILMLQSDYLPSLTRAGAIQNLDYIIDHSPLTRDLRDTGINAFELAGRRWALPFYFDTQIVFYNTDIVERIPEGWDLGEFERVLASIKNKGVSPITWNAYSAYWLLSFQIGFGKQRLIEPDGSIVINDQATYEALAYIMKLKEQGLLEVMERDGMISLFTSGRIGMILTGSYSIPQFQKIRIPFGVAPYPYNTQTGRYISPMLDFKGFAITKQTKHPILARRLIEYLCSVGVQQRFPVALSKMPANDRAWEITGPASPYYEVLKKSAEIGTVVPADNAYGVYKNTMWKLIRFIITGQMGIRETLDQGQDIINANLELQSTPKNPPFDAGR